MAEMREKLAHYLNIGSATTASYSIIGDGVTSLTEDFNAESDTKQYINQANGTTAIRIPGSRQPPVRSSKRTLKKGRHTIRTMDNPK